MLGKLFKNDYVINFVSRVSSLVFSIGASALITRYMGDSIKGDYSYITNFAAIASVVCNFGVYHGYPNQVKNGLENAKQKFVDFYFLLIL